MNNTGTFRCIGLSSRSQVCEDLLSTSNLIGNHVQRNGLIYSESKATIKDCSIFENTFDNTFHVPSSTYSIIVKNCSISLDDVKNTHGKVETISWSPFPSFFINSIEQKDFIGLCQVYNLSVPKQTLSGHFFLFSSYCILAFIHFILIQSWMKIKKFKNNHSHNWSERCVRRICCSEISYFLIIPHKW